MAAPSLETASPAPVDALDFLRIDSLLSDEERLVRDTVRAFVRDRLLPDVAGGVADRKKPAREVGRAGRGPGPPRSSAASDCSGCTWRATDARARARWPTVSRAWSSRPATPACAASSRCR